MAGLNTDMKILVLDPFPTMRKIIKSVLKQIGYENVIEADSDKSALSEIRDNPNVELVICDWDLPSSKGVEFIKSIRTDNKSKISFLVVTSETEKDHLSSYLKSGTDSYIVKPFNAASMQDKIEKIFSNRK